MIHHPQITVMLRNLWAEKEGKDSANRRVGKGVGECGTLDWSTRKEWRSELNCND